MCSLSQCKQHVVVSPLGMLLRRQSPDNTPFGALVFAR
jgi:hypothetical protein